MNRYDLPNISYIPGWLDPHRGVHLLDKLLASIPWSHEKLYLYGKWVMAPRQVFFCGEPDISYKYSGREHIAGPWPEDLEDIRHNLSSKGLILNCALFNLYMNGDDYMGWHSDNEDVLGESPTIVSLSLGVERPLIFRNKETKQKHLVSLEHSSLLIMKGDTQEKWQHCLPVRKKIIQPRINITFRHIVV